MSSLLCPDAFLSPLELDAVVTRALAEDLGRAGDVTSIATVPEETRGRAIVIARKAGTISGLPFVDATLRKLDPMISITAHQRDGDAVAAKTTLLTIEGDARAVLAAERTALNFLGHLSGIATATAAFVKLVARSKARVCCTRKTTPGLRALEKYAVRCGGGFNHRFGLDDRYAQRSRGGRGQAGAGSLGRHHGGNRGSRRRNRRGLSVLRSDHAFSPESRRGARYRDVAEGFAAHLCAATRRNCLGTTIYAPPSRLALIVRVSVCNTRLGKLLRGIPT